MLNILYWTEHDHTEIYDVPGHRIFCPPLLFHRLKILQSSQVDTGRKLPAVPRFPATLVRDLGAPQLAALVGLHIKAFRLSIQLVLSTRQGIMESGIAFSLIKDDIKML